MRKVSLVIGIIVTAVSISGVTQVVDSTVTDSARVVGARKAAMVAVNIQTMLLRLAVNKKDLSVAKDAAITLAALAGMMPPLYAESHQSAYPYPGSRYRFVDGDLDDFLAQIEALYSAALLASQAVVVKDINVSSIFSSCNSCHRSFRR